VLGLLEVPNIVRVGTRASNPLICYIEPMPEQTVIEWDLETIPDLAAAARMLNLGMATETEVREALGPGFPKHPLHKIVCIGALVGSRQPEGWRMDALGAPHTGERPEAKLISDFVEKIGQLRPRLITFNGHSFDLPVLRYRAMVNRISAAGLQVRQYFHRYAEDALDLCDVLGSYVPSSVTSSPSGRPIVCSNTPTWAGTAKPMCSDRRVRCQRGSRRTAGPAASEQATARGGDLSSRVPAVDQLRLRGLKVA
jgi:hypothetical protein